MKAAVLREFGKPLVIDQVETPVPESEDVLIKVQACGIELIDKIVEYGGRLHEKTSFAVFRLEGNVRVRDGCKGTEQGALRRG